MRKCLFVGPGLVAIAASLALGWVQRGASSERAEAAGLASEVSAFPDARDRPPEGWSGPVFRLRQDYPSEPPEPEEYPWKQIDFKTQPAEYLKAVLDYCCEGNVEVDWEPQRNQKRQWYHAPWLHWGRNGREFIHGLTHERPTQPGELAQTHTSMFQNWAVSLYNPPGGHVIGRVWRDPNKPNPAAARFPDGTVSVKLLFTQADPKQVPYLEGSLEWKAHIYRDTVTPTNPMMPREVQTVRLLQVDVGVRDSRADDTTGWVFGTFTYSSKAPGSTTWEKLVPIGLMWGNDPGVTTAQVRRGEKLKETALIESPGLPFQHLGWSGRLNGPVDNPISSCLSCHSTGQWPVPPGFSIVPRRTLEPDSKAWMHYFRNVKAEEPFSEGSVSLGYSLQLAAGIQNFHEWRTLVESHGGAINKAGAGLRLSAETPMSVYESPYSRGGDH